MQRTIFFVSILFLLACNGKHGLQNENGVTFDSDKLKGKYKLDISEIVAEITKPESDEISEKIAKGLVGLASASMRVEINFYGNGKGVSRVDYGWLGALANEKNQTKEFEYRIENDSILMFENKPLTIRKFSDSFDYIELIDKEENKKYVFNKIAE